MDNLLQNTITLHYANRNVNENGVEFFTVPAPVSGTIQDLSNSWKYLTQGFDIEGLKQFTIAKNTCEWRENNSLTFFAKGDRIWLDTIVPNYIDFNAGNDADYYIDSVSETRNYIVLILKRIT